MGNLRASIALLLLVSTAPARAQTSAAGFALDTFEPAERGSSWFFADSLELHGRLAWSAGLVGDYAYKPLVIYEDGTERTVIVRHQLQAHLGASVVLIDRVRLAASLPVVLVADGAAGRLGGTELEAPRGGAAGDLRLAADVRLFGQAGDAFTLAAGARIWLPVAPTASYGGDGQWRVSPQLLAAGTARRFEWAARVAFTWRQRELSFPGNSVGSQVSFGGAAGWTFLDDKLLVGPELFVSTRANGSELFQESSTPLEVMLGAHYRGERWRAGLGLSKGLVKGIGEPAFRVVFTMEYGPGRRGADRDGDGVPDAEDACPAAPGAWSLDAAKSGCPADADGDGVADAEDACPGLAGARGADPAKNGCPADADADGIPDAMDACPAVPGVRHADATKHGCPLDTDGDGVADADDACPEIAGARSADAAKHGCPLDSDGDGVPDARDACATEPGVPSDDPATTGCPVPKDGDADGVPDAVDACPDQPGAALPDPKKNGCPVGAVVGDELVLEQVKFKTGSAELLAESNEILTRVLESLKKLPADNRYRIEGHTDDQGPVAFNQRLSQRRAESVRAWFVVHGLAAQRFEARGFGPARPIAANDSDAGRSANRRVEIHILEVRSAK